MTETTEDFGRRHGKWELISNPEGETILCDLCPEEATYERTWDNGLVEYACWGCAFDPPRGWREEVWP